MIKKRCLIAGILFLLALGAFTACSSSKNTSSVGTPDYCSTKDGVRVPPSPKPEMRHPAAGTPVGGDYDMKKR